MSAKHYGGRRNTYHGPRHRGSLYTGRPGVPKYVVSPGIKVNRHDHSATQTRRRTWYEHRGITTQMPTGRIRYAV